MEELVLRAASVEEGEVARVLRWGSWTQLSPLVADYGIARIDAVGVGSCTVDDLPIDPRAPPLRWSSFCINMRSQWEWHQRSLCILVVLSFGCYLAAINFRGDRGGICNFRLKQLF